MAKATKPGKKKAPRRADVEWQRRAEVAERECLRLQDEIAALRDELAALRAEAAERAEPEADVPPEGGA